MDTGRLRFRSSATSVVVAELILSARRRTGIGFANARVQIVHNSASGESLLSPRFELKASLICSATQGRFVACIRSYFR
jgi:hypothetical protein